MSMAAPIPEQDPSPFLGEETEEKLLQAFAAGAAPMVAANFAGVSWQALYNWIHHGELNRERQEHGETLTESDARYVRFLNEIEERKGKIGLRSLAKLATSDKDDSHKWLLARLYPKDYGEKTQIEVEGHQSVTITIPNTEERDLALMKAIQEANLPLPEIIDAEIVEEAE